MDLVCTAFQPSRSLSCYQTLCEQLWVLSKHKWRPAWHTAVVTLYHLNTRPSAFKLQAFHLPQTMTSFVINQLSRRTQRSFLGALSLRQNTRTFAQEASSRPVVGLAAVQQAAQNPDLAPRPTIYNEFAIPGRIGLVTGGNKSIGLETALVLSEQGAKAVYCVDLPEKPSEEWQMTRDYVEKLGGRLEYIGADVSNQKIMWDIGDMIGDKEKRLDVCVAGAGILGTEINCLEYSDDWMKKVTVIIRSSAAL